MGGRELVGMYARCAGWELILRWLLLLLLLFLTPQIQLHTELTSFHDNFRRAVVQRE